MTSISLLVKVSLRKKSNKMRKNRSSLLYLDWFDGKLTIPCSIRMHRFLCSSGVYQQSKLTAAAPQPLACLPSPELVAGSSSSTAGEHDSAVVMVVDDEEADEAVPLIGVGECRICQEEDSVRNMECPCACSGSLKYAHRKCVQHWCNEKGDIICEICLQPYQPGYFAPPRPPPEETTIDIGGGFLLSGTPLDLHDPHFRLLTDAERRLFESDHEDYSDPNSTSAAFGRSAALILMTLLLLQQALSITDDGNTDGDVATIFSLIILRAVGFLLPFYIMIWAISILQRRRQQQEAAALTTAQLAIVVQGAQSRGLLVASADAPTVTPTASPQQERPQRNSA